MRHVTVSVQLQVSICCVLDVALEVMTPCVQETKCDASCARMA